MVDELLTTPEAAKRLRMQQNTLEQWRMRRPTPLPFIRIGRSIRYRASDVENFIEAQRAATRAEAA